MNLPRWLAAVPLRLRLLVCRAPPAQDLDDDVSFHLTLQAPQARPGLSTERIRTARLSNAAGGESLARGDGRLAQYGVQPHGSGSARAPARCPHDREHVAGPEAHAAARHALLL